MLTFPVPALRGRGRYQALYEAGGTDVILTVEVLESSRYALLGQVLGLPSGTGGRAVFCDLDGAEIARTDLDNTGSFVQTGLPAAPWEIHLYLSAPAGAEAESRPDWQIVLVAAGLAASHT